MNAPLSKQRLRIDALSSGGEGVGSLPSGKRIFVPFTAPGDRIEVELVEERPRFAKGRLLQVLEGGPGRVEARCPHYGVCGGCSLQHLSYQHELQAKEDNFYAALARIGGFAKDEIQRALPILASPAPWGSRIRCRLQVREGEVGYFARASHRFVPIQSCAILAPPLEALALAVGRWLAENPGSALSLSAIDLCVGPGGEGAAALHPAGGASESWVDAAAGILAVEGLVGAVALPGSEGGVATVFGDPLLAWPAAGLEQERKPLGCAGAMPSAVSIFHRPELFAQANAAGNRLLVEGAAAFAGLGPGERVLEFYAGAGNFSFALAASGAEVLAVEGEGAAIELARKAAEKAPEALRGRLRFRAGEVKRVLQELRRRGERFDCVFLDPPRSGAKGLMQAIAALGSQRIVYVSCDPATLARDLRSLSEAGYRLVATQPVDMFPRTHHVEGLALLEAEWKPAS